jgi:cyclic pyranopterin phosphate synthase
MVDVTKKPDVFRQATATGSIQLKPGTVQLIKHGHLAKGDVISLAQTAGILAAKKTSELIPLCHPLPLTNVDIVIEIVDATHLSVQATVKATAKTGVEMEALTAVAAALLTIWDMTKQHEKNRRGQYPTTTISDIRVRRKVKQP